MKLSKNQIKTPSYFIKRLKDNGFVVFKLFGMYAKADPRRWTIIINPGESSTLVTCYQNKEAIDDFIFELNDGGRYIPKNFYLKTDSIEVVIEYLLTHGASNVDYYPGKNKFVKDSPTVKTSIN